MKNKVLSLLLALCLVGMMFPSASAATVSNPIINGAYYGFFYEVYSDHVEITDYRRSDTDVVIPAEIEGLPVTVIGDKAFYDCSKMVSISIPDSITTIGNYAFSDCSRLTNLSIPDNVTSIGYCAFSGCSSLSSISIPGSIAAFGEYAFAECYGLTNVSIMDGITSISHSAFYDCTSLCDVSIPDSVSFIGRKAFYNCTNLSNIYIPESVTFLGSSAFDCCSSLTSISIPGSISYIEDSVFKKCSSLTNVSILDGITSIGQSAFSYCTSLTNIDLPDSLTSISTYAFNGCSNLSSISLPDSLTSIGGFAFDGCSSLIRISIPDSVTSIGERAFARCESLTNIDIPDSVTSIGDSAFYDCASLANIRFAGNAPTFGKDIFDWVTATSYYPAGNPTWTEDVMQDYGGDITWVAYDPNHTHAYTAACTAPTCTEQGFTAYTCDCGDSYVADYVDALGHEYEDGVCIRCGDKKPLENPFTDVPTDSFYYAPVLWAVENNITNGLTADSFGPTATCNRAQVVTFLWRAAGCPEPTSTVNPFVDVQAGSFYEKPVLWAVEKGITNGSDATHFGPTGVCNRAQVVTFLYRAFGSPAVSTEGLPFTDVPAGSWYEAPIAWALKNGITNGLSATEFGPNASCNRAQVVTFLYRAYTN